MRIPDKSAVIFFVDGMDRRRMQELLEAGELPNIKKHFVDGGVGVKYAVTSMPAITYPNSVSLLTGCLPGHHDIMGNLWFDRRTLEIPDYIHAGSYRSVNEHFDRKTIYEILHDHFTVNVQFHTRRGVTHTFDHVVPTGIDWYTHNFSGVDRRVGYTFSNVIRLANRARRWPTVIMFYFPGVDETGHRYGSDSARYAEALKVVDHSIGLVCEAIKASELVDRTYFVLTTDHGHVPTPPDRHFDLAGWFERERDLKVRTECLKSKSYDQRQRQLNQNDVILFTDGGRRAVIHLRGRGGWYSQPDQAEVDELIDQLVQIPAVELVVCRGQPHQVRMRTRDLSAAAERKVEGSTAFYRLRLFEGNWLGYLEKPIPESGLVSPWHDSRDWLRISARGYCPDFVVQIVEMFDSPRAGDIVLFAAEDWAFDGWSSGHGSCLAADMHVPMYFAGPELQAGGQIDYARNVDIMPTVLDLLGQAHRLNDIEPIDGRSVAGELRHARKQGEQTTAATADPGSVLSDPAAQPPDVRPRGVEPLGLGG
ncbi:MAG: alkaline phosphatase family protein [Phycisphaeraceae bacterium]